MEALVGHVERLAAATRAEATATLVALARAEAQRAADAGIGDGGTAPDWTGLAEHLDGIGDRYLAAYARWREAEAELRARGTRSDAERLLRRAWATAVDLRAEPLRRQIEALARRARVTFEPEGRSAPASVREAADGTGQGDGARAGEDGTDRAGRDEGAVALRKAGLSDREIEVLRLVAAGRTNGQIAERLFITRKTAGVHVTHILDKLAVANRVEAAMVAARLGLEPDDSEG
jgi:DNA-binding CsgD family transcriptional regulator